MASSRAIWSGAIQFGMVSVAVKLFTASTSKDFSFTYVHTVCNTRRKQQYVCQGCDGPPVITDDDVQRVYEVSKGSYLPITDDDLASLPLPSKNTIELGAFVDADDIDPIWVEKGYWLEPEPAGVKPYALLVRALAERGRVGVGKLALRNKEQVCMLRPSFTGQLILETLFWPDELRFDLTAQPALKINFSQPELDMACQLVDAFSEDFDPDKYQDTYRAALQEVITAKMAGLPMPTPAALPAAAPAVDLMAQLAATIAAKKKQKEVA